jgi:hypothetical protein
MKNSKKLSMAIFSTIVAIGGMQLGEHYGVSILPEFVSSAEAKVGRPLSPVSVAGVARRTARRCANGTYEC